MTSVLLMALTSLGAVALFVALAIYVLHIARTLEAIGGDPDSYLAKITFGVRAIEAETAPLPPGIDQLNAGMTQARDGLGQISADLDGVLAAVSRQGS